MDTCSRMIRERPKASYNNIALKLILSALCHVEAPDLLIMWLLKLLILVRVAGGWNQTQLTLGNRLPEVASLGSRHQLTAITTTTITAEPQPPPPLVEATAGNQTTDHLSLLLLLLLITGHPFCLCYYYWATAATTTASTTTTSSTTTASAAEIHQ